jgi:hypothetical protein
MNQSKIRNVLEVVTNIAVLLAATTVITVVAVNLFIGKNAVARKRNGNMTQSGLQPGQILPRLSGIDYNAAPKTLVIMMSTKCKFCLASLPFYSQIGDRENAMNGVLHIVAAFPNSSEEVNRFAAENFFPIETVAGLNLEEVGLRYTPTLVLVDNGGTILDTWVGQLTQEGEQSVLGKLVGPS